MAKILISDLRSIGSGLFVDPESFLDSMQDLSENELKQTFGGKDGSKSKSKKTKSKSYSYNVCPCPCPVMGGGGGSGSGGAN
jgi:hypothetical protein